MTCKSSYFKLCLEDVKRHLVAVIVTIALFVGDFMWFVLRLLSTLIDMDETPIYEMQTNVADICSPSGFEIVCAMLIGVFLAMQGFCFLHSKRKMDYYGSLPISRERRFAVICTNSILTFTIPLVLTQLIKSLTIFISGFGTKEAYANMMNSTLCGLLGFLALWAVASFVVIATGHLAISLAGIFAIVAYIPVWRFWICDGYCYLFLDTYVSTNEVSGVWYLFSPFSVLAKILPDWGKVWNWKEDGVWLIAFLVYFVVFGCLAYMLYKRRKNEMTGKAVAFPKANRMIQILLVIPCGMLSGLFASLWVSWINVWLIIPGAMIVCCVAHLLLEWIFQYDIRKVFRNYVQMILTTLFTVAIIMFIGLDLVGYDSYAPQVDDVRAIYVSTYSGEEQLSLEDVNVETEMSEELREDILSFLTSIRESGMEMDVEMNTLDLLFSTETLEFYGVAEVVYVTKDGTIKQRQYSFADEELVQQIAEYYNNREYREIVGKPKQEHIPDAVEITWEDYAISKVIELTEEEKEELAAIYKEEFCQATFEEQIIGELYMDSPAWTASHDGEYLILPVYPSCTETIAFLESKGLALFRLEEYNIIELEIYLYNDKWILEDEITIADASVIEKYRDQFEVYGYSRDDASYEVYAVISGHPEVDQIQLSVDEELLNELLKTQP